VSSHAAAPESRVGPPAAAGVSDTLSTVRPGVLLGVALAAALAALSFVAGGGVELGATTAVEIALALVAGLAGAFAVATLPDRAELPGAGMLLLFGALAALTALSVIWSVQPSDTWLETSRTLAYLATFATGLVLARIVPHRSASVLGGVLGAGVAVCGYALLTKIFPAALSADEAYARLREPYGYWNAVGLEAALAALPCLWLGTRRDGHAAVNALAYPALGLLLVTMALSYSRGALVALALGVAFWLWAVPGRRLRTCAVLGISGAGAAVVVAWAFARDTLSEDRVALDLRTAAGQELGVLLGIVLILLLAAGLAIGFAAASREWPGEIRRRVGIATLVVAALVPVGVAGRAALSDRGFTGSVSHAWETLTDPHARTPPNDPSRLTAVGSVRARYWNEALKIFGDHPVAGVGAGGYATARPRYRQDTLDVRHAHGYFVQTLADLGLVGLAVSLAALAAWLVAAGRALDVRRSRVLESAPRTALLALTAVVVVFGVHSFFDWTWFVPGNACVAALCAGWIAGYGRGELPGRLRPLRQVGTRRGLAAVAVLGAALAVAWAMWQPLRSVNAGNDALAALESGDIAEARRDALAAGDANPLSVEPLFDLAAVEVAGGRNSAALAALEKAVQLQPSNSETWLRLASFELDTLDRPREALSHLRAALYLDPRSPAARAGFLAANRRLTAERG
jgi:tetratricopeptide (TPR) repeat protein